VERHTLPASLLDFTLAAYGQVRRVLAAGLQVGRSPRWQSRDPGSCMCHPRTYTSTNQRAPAAPSPLSQNYPLRQPNRIRWEEFPVEVGLLTHLTRLTRLCTGHDVRLPNDPGVLPTAGGSLRALEIASDKSGDFDDPQACVEALLPVAAGLEALDVGASRLTPAQAARLAAALPRDIARLRIAIDDPGEWRRKKYGCGAWSGLPVNELELECPPADLALLARATRLERLSMRTLSGAEPAALAAELRALPRLRVLQLGDANKFDERRPLFADGAAAAAAAAAPNDSDAEEGAPPPAAASDAFVAAVAGLPFLRELSLRGIYVGDEAEAALLLAAPRLSALHLWVCGSSDNMVAGLAARLRAAAGRGALSLKVRKWTSSPP
jgi:hypothetical protein